MCESPLPNCNYPLHDAIGRNDIRAVQRMVSDPKFAINVIDNKGFSPLHLSVSRGYTEIVRALLSCGRCKANVMSGIDGVNDSSDNLQALHLASSYGYLPIVELLLNHHPKPPVNPIDRCERTPFYLSVLNNHYEIAALLIKHNADVNAKDMHGYTPLYNAISHNQFEFVKLMLNANVNIDCYDISSTIQLGKWDITEAIIDMYENSLKLIVDLEENQFTPIHAVLMRYSRVFPEKKFILIRKMIEKGADVNCINSAFGSPLHCIVYFSFYAGMDDNHKNTFNFLLKRKDCNLNALHQMIGAYRPVSIIEFAFKCNQWYYIERLLRSGVVIGDLHTIRRKLEDESEPHISFTYNPKAILSFKLLYYSGFKFFQPFLKKYIVKKADDHSYNMICKWIIDKISSPYDLKSLCRMEVRKIFGTNIRFDLSALDIPVSLYSYLRFGDIDDSL